MTSNCQVLSITRAPHTMDWKIAVAQKVNEIRRNRIFEDYSDAMRQVFFSLVEINVMWLGIYQAMLGQFVLEAQKLD